MKTLSLALRCMGWILALLMTSGCASTMLKGTPFYTATEEAPSGPARDRIYGWPLLYYREPVLSVAWPLFEKNDEFFAIRPIYSVHGLHKPRHEHNVLWPLAQWDWETGDHRIFPCFWGEDYRILFPLYWHHGHPLAGKGNDTLFPLWSYTGNGDDYSFWMFGPVYHSKIWGEESGRHLWPLAGRYSKGADVYRFYAWPLGHQWRTGSTRGADTLIPLYYRSWDPASSRFISPLWISGHEGNESWQCLIPVFYRNSHPSGNTFLSPLWCSHHQDQDGWQLLFPFYYHNRSGRNGLNLFPLGGWGNDAGFSHWSCLFPLYHHSSDDGYSRFLSLPWSQGSYKDGSSWRLAFPLYFNSASPRGSIHLTPLGGSRRTGTRTDWGVVPALSWGTKTPTSHSTWIGAGLAHHTAEADQRSHHVLPLYYSSSDSSSSTFLSLPYSRRETISGTRWDLAFPLVYRYRSPEQNRWITPLAAGGENRDGKEHWHTILPLYYRQQDETGTTLATLVGGCRRDNNGTRWNLWPLLSWGSEDMEGSDFWALAPLFHLRRTPQYVTHHALPLYYWNSRDDSFLSLLAARWRTEASNTVTLLPPALSWRTDSPDRKDLWVAGGLAHASWGAKPGPHHVVPLYYRNPETGAFLSPLLGRWNAGDDSSMTLIPPLLSMGNSNPESSNLWLLAGLARASWGDKPGSRYLLPLFYHDPRDGKFISPFLSKWTSGQEAQVMVIPPLLGAGSSSHDRRNLWLLAGLARASWGEKPGSRYLIPLFYSNPETGWFLSPLFARSLQKSTETRFYPPLLSMDTDDGKQHEIWGLAGLAHRSFDRETGTSSGYVFPLFYYDSTNTFLSPLAGRHNNPERGFVYPLTPLAGVRTGNRSGGWLFPFFSHTRHRDTGNVSGMILWGPYWRNRENAGSWMFPFYVHRRDLAPLNSARTVRNSTYVFPTFWKSQNVYTEHDTASRQRMVSRRNTFVPFWSRVQEGKLGQPPDVAENWALLGMWWSRLERTSQGPGQPTTLAKRRLLWMAYRYDRTDKETTIDVLPGLSITREKSGYRKTSFWGRLYRNEVWPDGRRNMDILCIPVVRRR